jgi:hypothetical protein
MVPLGMDEIIVYGIGKLKFAVFPSVKGRKPVLGRDIQVSPVIIWFYRMHKCPAE